MYSGVLPSSVITRKGTHAPCSALPGVMERSLVSRSSSLACSVCINKPRSRQHNSTNLFQNFPILPRPILRIMTIYLSLEALLRIAVVGGHGMLTKALPRMAAYDMFTLDNSWWSQAYSGIVVQLPCGGLWAYIVVGQVSLMPNLPAFEFGTAVLGPLFVRTVIGQNLVCKGDFWWSGSAVAKDSVVNGAWVHRWRWSGIHYVDTFVATAICRSIVKIAFLSECENTKTTRPLLSTSILN